MCLRREREGERGRPASQNNPAQVSHKCFSLKTIQINERRMKQNQSAFNIRSNSADRNQASGAGQDLIRGLQTVPPYKPEICVVS